MLLALEAIRRDPRIQQRFLILDLGDMPAMMPHLVPGLLIAHANRILEELHRAGKLPGGRDPRQIHERTPPPPSPDPRFSTRWQDDGDALAPSIQEEFAPIVERYGGAMLSSVELTVNGAMVAQGMVARNRSGDVFRAAVYCDQRCPEAAEPMRQVVMQMLRPEEIAQLPGWQSQAFADVEQMPIEEPLPEPHAPLSLVPPPEQDPTPGA
jgi:hypothetical protein